MTELRDGITSLHGIHEDYLGMLLEIVMPSQEGYQKTLAVHDTRDPRRSCDQGLSADTGLMSSCKTEESQLGNVSLVLFCFSCTKISSSTISVRLTPHFLIVSSVPVQPNKYFQVH